MLLNETMNQIQQPKSTVITIKQSSNTANNSLSKDRSEINATVFGIKSHMQAPRQSAA